MKKISFAVIFIFLFLALPLYAGIEISTDQRQVFFGTMRLGEEKELAQFGSYHNQVTCTSTNGNSWYLKINALQPLTSVSGQTIALEDFKWQMVWTNGNGTVSDPYHWRQFSLFPDLVYTSGPQEASGNQVKFNFKYYLRVPDVKMQGVYNTIIRFTLTEVL